MNANARIMSLQVVRIHRWEPSNLPEFHTPLYNIDFPELIINEQNFHKNHSHKFSVCLLNLWGMLIWGILKILQCNTECNRWLRYYTAVNWNNRNPPIENKKASFHTYPNSNYFLIKDLTNLYPGRRWIPWWSFINGNKRIRNINWELSVRTIV